MISAMWLNDKMVLTAPLAENVARIKQHGDLISECVVETY